MKLQKLPKVGLDNANQQLRGRELLNQFVDILNGVSPVETLQFGPGDATLENETGDITISTVTGDINLTPAGTFPTSGDVRVTRDHNERTRLIIDNGFTGTLAASQILLLNDTSTGFAMAFPGSSFSGSYLTNMPSGDAAVLYTSGPSGQDLWLGTSDIGRFGITGDGLEARCIPALKCEGNFLNSFTLTTAATYIGQQQDLHPGELFVNPNGATNAKIWEHFFNATVGTYRIVDDAFTAGKNYFAVTRSGNAVTAQDYGNATDLPPHTFNGQVRTTASTTSAASIRVPHGSAPTSPVNGDMWTTTSGLFVRINGTTVGPLS